jgi:hypothetical protein
VAMEGDLHPVDFVDYHAVFSDALTYLSKGMNVSGALDACLEEHYPLTYREIKNEVRSILSRLQEERDWGAVRALRELAAKPELAEEMRAHKGGEGSKHEQARSRHEVSADYPRVFSLALRKRQSGFSLDDSLEMAVRELYPQTFRKIKETASLYVKSLAQRRKVHELRALRDLAEDPDLLFELEEYPIE